MYIVIPSIGRLNEHHMVPENVCDAEDLVRSTSYGHGTDKTSRKPPTPTPPRTVCNVFYRYTGHAYGRTVGRTAV
jgi:hypothetical protein